MINGAAFAKDMHNAMKEAGWNVTLGPESKDRGHQNH